MLGGVQEGDGVGRGKWLKSFHKQRQTTVENRARLVLGRKIQIESARSFVFLFAIFLSFV